jgi:serine/threonine protein kinase
MSTSETTNSIGSPWLEKTLIQPSGEADTDSFPTIPGYRITREIARGGMGKVFEATDLSLGRTIAIKTILPGMDTSRFETESRITAQLPHPSIPPVHALGYLSDGTPFLAMKLIQGATLASLLKERASETDDVSRFVQIMEQVAQAVGFAHSQGMIHRDLKPQNIMVGPFGEIQVMDWGLAKKLGNEERFNQPSVNAMPENQATMAGTVMGTPGYMSPEQARGEPVDCRADVFSIGSMLSTVLTGSPAFVGSSAIETIQLASQGKLDDAMQRLSKPTIAPELRAIATRCLASNPEGRYQNGQEVADALAAYRNGLEQRLRSMEVERATELTRQLERKKRITLLGGAVVGGGLLSLVAYFASGHLASMNERIAAVTKADAAKEEKTAKDLELKKQEEKLRLELMGKIQEPVSKPVCRAFKRVAAGWSFSTTV